MSHMDKLEYDDIYPTCVETYSTLRLFSDAVDPSEMTETLHIKPTDSFKKGDAHCRGQLHRKTNGWFYSTEKLIQSKDTRRHIDVILGILDGKDKAVEMLSLKGCEMDIVTYWVSRGQGGPEPWPHQMLKLGTMGISVGWDIYFKGDEKT